MYPFSGLIVLYWLYRLAGPAWRGLCRLFEAFHRRPSAAIDRWLVELSQAHQLAAAGELEAAARSAREALRLAREGPDEANRTARSLGQVVWIQLQLGNVSEARNHLREMEALVDSGQVPLVSHAGSDLHEFHAALHRMEGRPSAAETHLRAAIHIEEKLGGTCTPTLRTALAELAQLYRLRHHYTAAAATLERMKRLEYPTPEENGRARREALLELGTLELVRDNRAAAQAHFAAVVGELEAIEAVEWRRLSAAWHGLAEVQARAGRHADAEELLDRALRLRRANDPENRMALLPLLDARARLLAASGRIDEAESVRREILIIAQGTFGLDSPHLADPLEELADLKVRQHRPEEAVPLIEKATRLRWQAGGPGHPALTQVLDKQAALLRSEGYLLQAEATQATSRDIGERRALRWQSN